MSSPGTHQGRGQQPFKDGVYQMVFFFPRLEVKHAGKNTVGSMRDCLLQKQYATIFYHHEIASVRGRSSRCSQNSERARRWEPPTSLSRWHSPKTSSLLALLVFLEIDLHTATGFGAPDCE